MTTTQQINAYLDTLEKPLLDITSMEAYKDSVRKHVADIQEKFRVDRKTAMDIFIDYILASK
jgi:hypothetical protein